MRCTALHEKEPITLMTARYWLFVALTLALTLFTAYGAYRTSLLLKQWQPDRNLLLLPGENVVRWAMIVGCVGLGLLSGLPLPQLGWTGIHLTRDLLLGIVLGSGLALIFYFATRWFVTQTGARFYSDQIVAYVVPTSGREYGLVALAMVGVALLEELLFRSLLLGGLEPILPRWLLLLGSALLFGAMHSPQGLWGMGGAALAGLLLGLLFFRAGSLLLPLVTHYVTNMLQITLVLWLEGAPDYAAGNSSATGTGDNSS
jgi:membrane protease YdiL (CAAX protease family)